jgi:hypothetical protein
MFQISMASKGKVFNTAGTNPSIYTMTLFLTIFYYNKN